MLRVKRKISDKVRKKSAAQLNKYLRKKTKHKQDYKYEIYKDGNHFSIIPNVIVKTFSLFYKSE
jgi:hypothetical protein